MTAYGVNIIVTYVSTSGLNLQIKEVKLIDLKTETNIMLGEDEFYVWNI